MQMKTNFRTLKTWLLKGGGYSLLAFTLLSLHSAQAAESMGNSLPYESWLRTLQQSLTGPVAFSVAMIGIVSCGATLIFAGGEIGRFMRALIYVVMVMTMLIGANSLMTRFFNGASIGTVTASAPQLPPTEMPDMPHGKRMQMTLHPAHMLSVGPIFNVDISIMPQMQRKLLTEACKARC